MSEKRNNQPREDIGEDLNIASILMIGLCYALVIAISMILLAALHQKKTRAETERKSATTGVSALDEARTQQAMRIGSYEWVEYEAGVIRLPIERAMELATERLAEGQPLGLAPESIREAATTPVVADETVEATSEIDAAAELDDTNTRMDGMAEPAPGVKE